MDYLSKHEADQADEIVDRLLDLIDQEPEPVRVQLLAAIKAGSHRAYRQDDGSTVVTFPDSDVQYQIVRARRFDA